MLTAATIADRLVIGGFGLALVLMLLFLVGQIAGLILDGRTAREAARRINCTCHRDRAQAAQRRALEEARADGDAWEVELAMWVASARLQQDGDDR